MCNALCLLFTINTYYMLPWKLRFLYTSNEIFLRNSFILIKLHSVNNLVHINILLGYRVGLGSSQPIT